MTPSKSFEGKSAGILESDFKITRKIVIGGNGGAGRSGSNLTPEVMDKVDKQIDGAMKRLGSEESAKKALVKYEKTFKDLGSEESSLDQAVRDICELPYRSKSEVRGIVEKLREGQLSEIIGRLEWMKEETRNFPMKSNGGNWDNWNEGYDKALSKAIALIRKI